MQRKEELQLEKQKQAAAAVIAKEAAKESEEERRMFVEERRSWDAYELNTRNYNRMVEKVRPAAPSRTNPLCKTNTGVL